MSVGHRNTVHYVCKDQPGQGTIEADGLQEADERQEYALVGNEKAKEEQGEENF